MSFVSVIIPVYKVEGYIEKCATSIFAQTLDSLEIIFIDDCTPDKSVEIIKKTLEKFPKRQNQTRIITMPSNSGQAAVRRHGIIEAKGDFIIQCDGDDWVDAEFYEELYRKAIETNADIVCGNFLTEEKNNSVLHKLDFSAIDGKTIIESMYHKPIHLGVWNKLVKRTLFTNNNILPWIGLDMWEDNGLMYRLLYYAKKVVRIDGPCYHYNRLNVSAMTANYGMKQVNQMIAIAQNLTDFFKDKPDSSRFYYSILDLQFRAKINLITDSFQRLKLYKEIFPNAGEIIPYLKCEAFSTKGRIRYLLVRAHLTWLFIILFKMRNIIYRFMR